MKSFFALSSVPFLFLCACSSVETNDISDEKEFVNIEGNFIKQTSCIDEEVANALKEMRYSDALLLSVNKNYSDGIAYIADCVMDTKELQKFVLENVSKSEIDGSEVAYTFARRLLREGKWAEARNYFPEAIKENFDAYILAIQKGYNFDLPDEERAKGFWDAALIVRESGDALFSSFAVQQNEDFKSEILLIANKDPLIELTENEKMRVRSRDLQNHFLNDRRFRAATLVKYAASLLPNNDDRTARLLCAAGMWVRYKDPIFADEFYKSLVIRCPKTDLGKQCESLRWFPADVKWKYTNAWQIEEPVGIKDDNLVEKVENVAVEETIMDEENH